MPMAFEKLSSKTLRGQIAQRLRDAILDGRLAPGDKLVERQLAAEFGASLTAVREAIIQLETEGFIIKRPNAATYVTKLSIEDIEKVFTLRMMLETHAIEEACRRATPEAVADTLLRAFAELGAPPPEAWTAHRWRYADTEPPLDACHVWDVDRRIGLCGDWLNGGKVEGAWLSGRSLAQDVLQHFASP